ncbi:MAG: hypothetical protein D3923_02400 [Candidatus Electrothrix sp. AR3]|nr:hypothetical protein [Candidatus Electrothrix sp. AR3]
MSQKSFIESLNRILLKRKKTNSAANKNEVAQQSTNDFKELANFKINVSVSSREEEKIGKNNTLGRWISPNKLVKIGNYKIERGFFYLGGTLDARDGYLTDDSALIDPTLPVNEASPDYNGNEMGHWPSYSTISPKNRSAYLEWLASKRDNPDAYIGYVFLYFYGLERRLLIDREKGVVSNKETALLFREIKRLLGIYGSSDSFRSYAVSLLSYIWIFFGAKGKTPYDLLFINNSPSPIFYFILANTIDKGKPVPANLAFAWLKIHSDYKLKIPAKRCPKKFRVLFKKRYKEKFFQTNGMIVKSNKTKLVIEYRPANSSLHAPRSIETNLPDPARLRAPVNKLIEIAELCQGELSNYSRFVGRQGNKKGSAAAVVLLPPDLIAHLNLPGIERIKKNLNTKLKSGYAAIPVKYILNSIGDKSLLKLNKKECETIAKILAAAGYGMAPDIRYHHAKPEKNGIIIIFHQKKYKAFTLGNNFEQLVTVLRLGSMVAKIDDKVERSEVQLLNNLIQQDSSLIPYEKISLKAYLYWLLSAPANMRGVKARLKKIGKEKKAEISRILINVAHANGHIAPEEVKQLEKLYTSLGLEKTTVINDLHQIKTEKKEANTHPLKKDNIITEKNTSNIIDIERLRLHEEETAGVKNILEQIFVDPEETSDTVQESVSANKVEPSSEELITGLDTEHQILYNRLITKNEWQRDEIMSICEQMKLMLDGSIEAINDSFFEIADAPLIEEYGDIFYIDIDLTSEVGMNKIS